MWVVLLSFPKLQWLCARLGAVVAAVVGVVDKAVVVFSVFGVKAQCCVGPVTQCCAGPAARCCVGLLTHPWIARLNWLTQVVSHPIWKALGISGSLPTLYNWAVEMKNGYAKVAAS